MRADRLQTRLMRLLWLSVTDAEYPICFRFFTETLLFRRHDAAVHVRDSCGGVETTVMVRLITLRTLTIRTSTSAVAAITAGSREFAMPSSGIVFAAWSVNSLILVIIILKVVLIFVLIVVNRLVALRRGQAIVILE